MFNVYNYFTKEYLGDFLSIETTTREGVKVWFLSTEGLIRSAALEAILIRKADEEGLA